jgi:SNF2 family DNA or RNA helicase
LFEGTKPDTEKTGLLRFSKMDILRLRGREEDALVFKGDEQKLEMLNRVLQLRPCRSHIPLEGMVSGLRSYQQAGLHWLYFLYENGLGGLLCDDMGLGKTHQMMALMVAILEGDEPDARFLVVCPTTVLGHWDRKIMEHAPSLKTALYYGGDRDLETVMETCNVVLTTYGLLRNDIERLREWEFTVAAFDEIQHIKNPETKGYLAALEIRAGIKIGITGTPVENDLKDLKALMDLTVPGYLGPNESFADRFSRPIQEDNDGAKQKELSRLITPFTLRRRKSSVLKELPEKIEDTRFCRLSEDQVKLYRDAIESRGRGLLETLRIDEKPIPYIHVFALLNLLKQICNHPALVNGKIQNPDAYQSGKWDLFSELLTESLESGQKVVVYSQYLGMIRLFQKLVDEMGVDYVSLTGSTRKREEVVSRFNEDTNCRVFLGSLLAGGVGIDLVAASVVIHYDRWWNAAREDQATDRVHRIGQNRGVQVFKLVTQGTLEERIDAIIQKKRNLMEGVIREDDPGLLKSFLREDLIAMLTF